MKISKKKIILSAIVLILVISTLSVLVACISKPKTVNKTKTLDAPETLVGYWTKTKPEEQNEDTEAVFGIEKRDGKLYLKEFAEYGFSSQAFLNVHPILYDEETELYNFIFMDLKIIDDNTLNMIYHDPTYPTKLYRHKTKKIEKSRIEPGTVDDPETFVGEWTHIEPKEQNKDTKADFIVEKKKDGKIYFTKYISDTEPTITKGYCVTHPILYDKITKRFIFEFYSFKFIDKDIIQVFDHNDEMVGKLFRLKK